MTSELDEEGRRRRAHRGETSGGSERRLLWIERERGEPRLRRVKDAWAEGSAGLRVVSKQRQTFYIPPKKGKSRRRSVPFPVNPSPLHCLPSPKGHQHFGTARLFRTLVGSSSLSSLLPILHITNDLIFILISSATTTKKSQLVHKRYTVACQR